MRRWPKRDINARHIAVGCDCKWSFVRSRPRAYAYVFFLKPVVSGYHVRFLFVRKKTENRNREMDTVFYFCRTVGVSQKFRGVLKAGCFETDLSPSYRKHNLL